MPVGAYVIACRAIPYAEAPRLWLAYGETVETFHDMPKRERLPRAEAALMQACNHCTHCATC
jgi:hypothetical protein